MEVLLLAIYATIVWLIFFKFKLLPWTTAAAVVVVTIPIIGLAALMLLLNVVAPSALDVQVVKYVVQVNDRRIEVVVFDRAIQVRRVAGLDEHVDLRKGLDHARQHVGQQARQRGWTGTQPQFAGHRVVVGNAAKVGDAAHQVARAVEDPCAFLGDADGAAHARDQRGAELALDGPDLLGDGGRRDVQHTRRSG